LKFFARSDSFSAVPRASTPIFMFCVPGHIFGGTEGVGSRFHVLCARTHFRRYRGSRVAFSSFSPVLVFDDTESVDSHFIFLCARSNFWQYRGRRLPFSLFAPRDSFSAVSRMWTPVFKFCALGLVFDGTEGGDSRFKVLGSQTRFRR
jgi:hypothetical protein